MMSWGERAKGGGGRDGGRKGKKVEEGEEMGEGEEGRNENSVHID